jgi:hypothetical protein
MEIRQGWDRYDALEAYQRLRLSSDVLQQAYAGIRWTQRTEHRVKTSVFFCGGSALLARYPTQLGKTAVLRYSQNPFFIGAGFAFRWDWRTKPAGHER